MRPETNITLDYASKNSTDDGWPRSLNVAYAFCVLDIVMWSATFVNPRLAFSNALALPMLGAYLASWIATIVGIVVVCSSKKTVPIWFALAIFIATVLLNMYAFLWCVGMARI